MLGKLISQEKGQITGVRVLSSDPAGPKMEATVQMSGQILGVADTQQWTYWSVTRPDGTLYGEGQGVITTKNGDVATGVGQAAGTVGRGGAVKWRGAVYLYSKARKLLPLNKMAVVFEYDVDQNGKAQGKFWEWK